MTNKEVYVNRDSNAGTIATGATYIVDPQETADKSDYLPFNKLRINNTSSHEIYVFLEGIGDGTTPDYIIPSGSGVDESVLEGVQYNQLVIKNSGGGTIGANEIISRIATVRNVQ